MFLTTLCRSSLIALAMLCAAPARAADPPQQQGDWVVKDFRFHTGEVLPELKLHYVTIGEPTGEPVLVLHGSSGSSQTMLGKGYSVKIYDSNVSLAKLFGANKEYIEKEIPHLDRLMCSTLDEVTADAEVLVVANRNDEFRRALGNLRDGQRVLDLVRILPDPPEHGEYHGICW